MTAENINIEEVVEFLKECLKYPGPNVSWYSEIANEVSRKFTISEHEGLIVTQMLFDLGVLVKVHHFLGMVKLAKNLN